MGSYKAIFALLILYGIASTDVGSGVVAAKACPLYCLEVDYMTCQSSGYQKLPPRCNCCLAPKNCTLHLTGGTSVQC
ncbi:hypothetical protein K2173_008941 [Erythroxylum novogranatense]|uniref:Uncharacterized protein n=1 Tax=Erythroxylum novogranatense TaxID=1862640 RepID=A0AAV8TVB5_9ROSI|nr:hypothetical protein K2173_008941 [Erythroxylum novogranatense]